MSPKRKPSAHTTRPQTSRVWPLIPPRKVACLRSGSTRAASPPPAWCPAGSCAASRAAASGTATSARSSGDRTGTARRSAERNRVIGERLLSGTVMPARTSVGTDRSVRRLRHRVDHGEEAFGQLVQLALAHLVRLHGDERVVAALGLQG